MISLVGNFNRKRKKNQTDSEEQPPTKKRETNTGNLQNKDQESMNPSSSNDSDLSKSQSKAVLNFPNLTKPNHLVELPILPFESRRWEWTHQKDSSYVLSLQPNSKDKQAFDTCLKIQSEISKARDMLWKIGEMLIHFDQTMFPHRVTNELNYYHTFIAKIIECQKHFKAINHILQKK